MQSEENPSVEEFVATAEQELYYQKTRMFMEEARESLPLIGIRAYNPIAAAKRAYQASIAGNASDTSETSEESEASDDEQEVLLDDRGLKDGEIWIRINAANSGEHLEIMAQTADLYRSNTGFDGEVTVMVWVGGQPWIRETFE
ncbi:hypothetical protein [uncultured Desulfosarcina sp.]|uniref:hypothetical protein n=1 Tax=uncultured Desulfosarcina sp. TaxID=218289 RepID=UPI0029C63756|nr:hypothetical protein [uncultured Desulfosarcina sp.]